MVPQSPRFQSACGGTLLLPARMRSATAVPAISECLWRRLDGSAPHGVKYRSPRDFRVLVAVRRGVVSDCAFEPQSPRFQSACGGQTLRELVQVAGTAVPAISECLWRMILRIEDTCSMDRSPRDFRVLVAAARAGGAGVRCVTAVPAISECLWRPTQSTPRPSFKIPQSPRFQSACGGSAGRCNK